MLATSARTWHAPRSKQDAELLQWILEQVRTAFHQRKVLLLKFWVRRSPVRLLSLLPWAEFGERGVAEAWANLADGKWANVEGSEEGSSTLDAGAAEEGSEQTRNVP